MRALVGFGSKRTTRRVTCMADQLPELPWVRGVWDGWTHGTFLGLLVLRVGDGFVGCRAGPCRSRRVVDAGSTPRRWLGRRRGTRRIGRSRLAPCPPCSSTGRTVKQAVRNDPAGQQDRSARQSQVAASEPHGASSLACWMSSLQIQPGVHRAPVAARSAGRPGRPARRRWAVGAAAPGSTAGAHSPAASVCARARNGRAVRTGYPRRAAAYCDARRARPCDGHSGRHRPESSRTRRLTAGGHSLVQVCPILPAGTSPSQTSATALLLSQSCC